MGMSGVSTAYIPSISESSVGAVDGAGTILSILSIAIKGSLFNKSLPAIYIYK